MVVVSPMVEDTFLAQSVPQIQSKFNAPTNFRCHYSRLDSVDHSHTQSMLIHCGLETFSPRSVLDHAYVQGLHHQQSSFVSSQTLDTHRGDFACHQIFLIDLIFPLANIL